MQHTTREAIKMCCVVEKVIRSEGEGGKMNSVLVLSVQKTMRVSLL